MKKAKFTRQQERLLKHLVKGLTAKEIGEKMGLSFRTVEKHTASLMLKTRSRNKTVLVVKAITKGWI